MGWYNERVTKLFGESNMKFRDVPTIILISYQPLRVRDWSDVSTGNSCRPRVTSMCIADP